MLDCEDEKCARVKIEVPHTVDYLCGECSVHFKKVLDSLDSIDAPYILNPYLVRGLDYYTKTVFEFYQEEILAEDDIDMSVIKNEPTNKKLLAIASGGRYDGLVKLLGGKDTPGVGCAIGIERTLELMRASKKEPSKPAEPRVFLVQLGDRAKKRTFTLMEEFRKAGIGVREALGRDSISAQLKLANKFKVDLAVIIGQKEVISKSAIIREMKTGSQEIIPEEKLIAEVKKFLKKIPK
jgi:histidyl-tRNA synthetase